MPDITKPEANPNGYTTTVRTLETTGSGTIPAFFTYASILGKGTSGTYTVKVGDQVTQTLPAGTPFNLPQTGRMYEQAVVFDGGGTVTLEIAVGY